MCTKYWLIYCSFVVQRHMNSISSIFMTSLQIINHVGGKKYFDGEQGGN